MCDLKLKYFIHSNFQFITSSWIHCWVYVCKHIILPPTNSTFRRKINAFVRYLWRLMSAILSKNTTIFEITSINWFLWMCVYMFQCCNLSDSVRDASFCRNLTPVRVMRRKNKKKHWGQYQLAKNERFVGLFRCNCRSCVMHTHWKWHFSRLLLLLNADWWTWALQTINTKTNEKQNFLIPKMFDPGRNIIPNGSTYLLELFLICWQFNNVCLLLLLLLLVT